MLDFRFIKDKLRGFRLRVFTRIKSFDIFLYVKRLPQRELTPQRRYLLELEKAGKVRQVAERMWEFTD